MEKMSIRILLIAVLIIIVVTFLCVIFLWNPPTEQTSLLLSDVPLRIENNRGEKLIYDGQGFSGNMPVYARETYQLPEPEIFLTVPFSQEYFVIPDAGKMAMDWETESQIRSVSGTGISKARISLSSGIMISGTEMEFKMGLNAPCLPSPSVARFYGLSQGELEIRPIDEGFEINGTVSFLEVSVNFPGTSIKSIVLELEGTKTVVDLTRLIEENVIVLIDDNGEVRIVQLP